MGNNVDPDGTARYECVIRIYTVCMGICVTVWMG